MSEVDQGDVPLLVSAEGIKLCQKEEKEAVAELKHEALSIVVS
jgi:hypothetical protein